MPEARSTHTAARGAAHPKQGQTSATPNEAAALIAKADALATAAGASLPSVLDLGMHLADLHHAWSAFDDITDLKEGGPPHVRAGWASRLLDDREEALREVIATQPATSMGDAAVQVAVLAHLASILPGGDERTEHLSTMIERLALSVLPIVAGAASLDLERMAWSHPAGAMRVARFCGVGVQS